jgi:hypothetical protein
MSKSNKTVILILPLEHRERNAFGWEYKFNIEDALKFYSCRNSKLSLDQGNIYTIDGLKYTIFYGNAGQCRESCISHARFFCNIANTYYSINLLNPPYFINNLIILMDKQEPKINQLFANLGDLQFSYGEKDNYSCITGNSNIYSLSLFSLIMFYIDRGHLIGKDIDSTIINTLDGGEFSSETLFYTAFGLYLHSIGYSLGEDSNSAGVAECLENKIWFYIDKVKIFCEKFNIITEEIRNDRFDCSLNTLIEMYKLRNNKETY